MENTKKIAQFCQESIENTIELHIGKCIADYLDLNSSIHDFVRAIPNFNPQRITGEERGYTVAVKYKKNQQQNFDVLSWIHPKIVGNLEQNDLLDESVFLTDKLIEDFLTVAEEASHFVYDHYYFTKGKGFGTRPIHELVAVVDQYGLLDYLSTQHNQDLDQEQMLRKISQASYHPHDDVAYLVGHRLGFVYLAHLLNQNQESSKKEWQWFYRLSDQHKIQYLNDSGFFFSSTSAEAEVVREFLAEMGWKNLE